MDLLNQLDHSLSPIETAASRKGAVSYHVHEYQSVSNPACLGVLYDNTVFTDAVTEGQTNEKESVAGKESVGVLCSSFQSLCQRHLQLQILNIPQHYRTR
jgi:hypothetical protein